MMVHVRRARARPSKPEKGPETMANEFIQRYYNGVVAAKRINAPTIDEAAKDFARVNTLVF
jgi:hypothetical protein